jgi:hypothetical protein
MTNVKLDTVIGKGHKQALVSLTERKSQLVLFDPAHQQRTLC